MLKSRDYLKEKLNNNFNYIKKNGYKGYDPQIFWYLYFARRYNANSIFINKIFQKIETVFFNLFPSTLEPYLKIQKIHGREVVPYGIGLYLQALSKLYLINGDKQYLDISSELVEELNNQLVMTDNGLGAPNSKKKFNRKFGKNYSTNKTIYLPSGVEVFNGVIDFYKITKSENLKIILKKMVDSFTSDFEVKKYKYGICLDYSNIGDKTHILNANTLVGGAISDFMRLSDGLEEIKFKDYLIGIDDYVTPYISWEEIPYSGKEDAFINPGWNTYDCYHTGFTLRGLRKIRQYLGRSDGDVIKQATLMLDNFLDSHGCIQVFFKKKYYQDIHAVAEYINILAIFFDQLPLSLRKFYIDIAIKNIRNFSTEDGTYFYRILPFGIKVKLYMPRWSHTPMMNALAELILAIDRNYDCR